MKPKFISFIPAILWFITTFILLTIPGPDIPKEDFFAIPYLDKWVHIGIFSILVTLFCWPFLKLPLTTSQLFLRISIAAICYGIAMEFVQKFWTVDRTFDIWDICADTIGSFAGFFFIISKYKTLKKKSIGQ